MEASRAICRAKRSNPTTPQLCVSVWQAVGGLGGGEATGQPGTSFAEELASLDATLRIPDAGALVHKRLS